MSTTTHLQQLPDLAAEAFATWGAPNPADRAERTNTIPGPRVPVDLDTLTALRPDEHGLLFELAQCSRAVAEALDAAPAPWPDPIPQPEVASWVGEVGYLLHYRLLWESDPWLRETVETTVADIHATLTRITRQPKPLALRCPDCDAQMTPEDGGHTSRCTEGHEHPGPKRVAAIWSRKPPVPAAIIQMELGVKPELLRQWKRRGKISPARTDGRVDYWSPWDVIMLLYPDLADILDSA